MCFLCPPSTTDARACGRCFMCGGELFEFLVHHCTTTAQPMVRSSAANPLPVPGFIPPPNGTVVVAPNTWQWLWL